MNKHETKKKAFLVPFWSFPMLDICCFTNRTIVLHGAFLLHLHSSRITWRLLSFFKTSTGGISAALGECFDFLWHAPG